MRAGDDPGFRRQQLVILIHAEITVVVAVHDLDDNALLGPQELPRHDVGVVFHHGDDDFIARVQERPPIAGGNQIDGFRPALGEDDLVMIRRVQKAGDLVAGLFIGIRRQLAHAVIAAMT